MWMRWLWTKFANARSHADVFRKELKAKIMKGVK